MRPDWVPSLLRDGGAHTTDQSSPVAACRFPAASPIPRLDIPSPRLSDDEAFEDSPTFTRPDFPSPVAPGWSGDPWAYPSSFGPRRHQRRPLRWGQALEHWPGTTRSTWSILQSVVHSRRATSCRTLRPNPTPLKDQGEGREGWRPSPGTPKGAARPAGTSPRREKITTSTEYVGREARTCRPKITVHHSCNIGRPTRSFRGHQRATCRPRHDRTKTP
jgi:hypothetical protein